MEGLEGQTRELEAEERERREDAVVEKELLEECCKLQCYGRT